MLTPKQKKILSYIKNFIKENDYSPSFEEIRRHFKLASKSTVHQYIEALRNKGYLGQSNHRARSIEILDKKLDSIDIPILGLITAGQPIEAIEVPDGTVTVPKKEVSKTGKHYALRVEGSSMIDEGIFDGDIVVIRQEKVAENGQTVVAIIDDNEATLKKLYREKDIWRLQPANPSLFPIYRKEVEIRGIVVKILRKLESPVKKKGKRFIKRIDYSWDYKGQKTKSHTHGLHAYPAMFIPQIAKRLIQTYSTEKDTICDIFCGSGTALIESRLLNRNSYGIDLNPFAIFLAKVKTTEIDPSKLTKRYFALLNDIEKIKDNEIQKPDFFNIDFWFKEKTIIQLAKIKKAIKNIKDKDIRNFFLVAFSHTARLASNTKNGEFKLVRIKGDKLEKHNPNVAEIFKKKVEFNIGKMTDFYNDVNKEAWTKIIYGDSSKNNNIKKDSIDCIITSPPYGDSRTTVAYGQFSRLSAQWIDIFENPNKASGVDKKLLGGKPSKNLSHNLNSKYLDEIIKKISGKDEKRAKDVLSFYVGLNKCLKRAHYILKPKKYFCLVIGNRTVKQTRIPTDFIIAELSENIGFTCEDIIVRNIPTKRMPKKTSPTNVAGELEETMNKESIVVLRKL